MPRQSHRPRYGKQEKQAGFTLIEILIVIVIVGILAAIAYPGYQDSVRKARRNIAKVEIMSAAQQMERCFTVSSNYADAACPTAVTIQAQLDNTNLAGAYTITLLPPPTATTYTITATATGVGNQDSDTQCLILDLDQAGAHPLTTTTTCW